MSLLTKQPLLLLIDLQKAIDDPSWGERNNPEAEQRIAELLALWRQRKMPILHVKHMSTEPNSTYRPGQIGNEFKDVAKPLVDEKILKKQTNSAFIGTDLEARLRTRSIDEIVIVGVITNNSVEATARMAGNLGFNTIVVSDATFTFGKTDLNGVPHSAETVHAMSLANLKDEYAQILSTNEVIALIMNQAGS